MNRIKSVIKQMPLVGDFAVWANSRMRRTWKAADPSYWLGRIVCAPEAQVVQIGSNDGITRDPLGRLLRKKKGWKAVLVEPVPYLFERLKKNYGGSNRFTFENVAVNNGEKACFYWVDESAKT